MGLFDFLKPKGIDDDLFYSKQFQAEHLALAKMTYDKHQNYVSVLDVLQSHKLNKNQCNFIIDKLKPIVQQEATDALFNTPQFQAEYLALGQTVYFENGHDYEAVFNSYKKLGFQDEQCNLLVERLKEHISAMVHNYKNEVAAGNVDIKIGRNPNHTKDNITPEDIDKYIAYGAHQMDGGYLENALELFNTALEFDENAVLAYANKGTLYAKMNKLEEALEMYNKALSLKPDDASIIANKASVLDDLGQKDQAIEQYKLALEKDAKNEHALCNLGIMYSEAHQYERAIEQYDRLLALNPLDDIAVTNKLNSLVHLSIEKASAYYNSLNEEQLADPTIHFVIPAYLYQQDEKEMASVFFDSRINAKDHSYLRHKANFYYKEEPILAYESYNQYLQIEPTDVEALQNRMSLAFDLGDQITDAEFMQSVNALLAVDKEHIGAQSFLAQYYLKENKLEDALGMVKKLFANYHYEPSVIQLLLAVFSKLSKEEAMEQFDLFQAEYQGDTEYQLLYCKGLYLKTDKDFKHAIKVFNVLNNLEPFAWAYYQIALIHNLQGKTEECLANLKTAISMSDEIKEDAKQFPELENLKSNPEFMDLIS